MIIKSASLRKSKYYTYTPKELKPISLLLKGLHKTYDEEDVVPAVNEIKFPHPDTKVVKIMKYTTTKSRIENKNLSIYLVQFGKNSRYNINSVPTKSKNRMGIYQEKRYHSMLSLPEVQPYSHKLFNASTMCEM